MCVYICAAFLYVLFNEVHILIHDWNYHVYEIDMCFQGSGSSSSIKKVFDVIGI